MLSIRHNFSPFIRNPGRWTRWWEQFLYRKQNWRYFCACAVKKLPKHSDNAFRQKRYFITGKQNRRSKWPGQIFDSKLVNGRFCACAVKNRPKIAYCVVKSPKFQPLYGQSQSLNTTVFKPDKNLILSANCNKTANINVKKTQQFKTVFNGDTAYITQLKQQKSKRCYYLGPRWHYGDVLQK